MVTTASSSDEQQSLTDTRRTRTSNNYNTKYGAATVLDNIKNDNINDDDDNEDDENGGAFPVLDQLRQSLANLSEGEVSSTCSIRDFGGTATIPSEIMNLVKNIVGAGMLALPSGIAAYGSAPGAVYPAIVYIFLMGLVFGYYFHLLGRICHWTHKSTFRELWEDTMGEKGVRLVSLVYAIKPAIANLMYSMILADTGYSLFQTIGWNLTRLQSLVIVTVAALLPLSLLKNLNALAATSLLGTIGMFSTALLTMVRYADGSYGAHGRFVNDLPRHMQPAFGTVGASGALSPHAMILLCLLFEAFVAHYNAPRFYTELKDHSSARFATVVGYSFGVSCLVYSAVAVFGFWTFGTNSDGYILNNYSTNDELATACRSAIGIAIIFTYPVTFLGVRDGAMDLMQVPMEKQTARLLNIVSIGLLCIITFIAAIVTDLGFVNAVGGGTIATVVVFVLPTFMFRAVVHNVLSEPTREQAREVQFAVILMVFGIIIGIVGVWIAVNKQLNK